MDPNRPRDRSLDTAKIGMTLVLVGLSFPVLTTVVERVVDHAMRAMAALMGG